MNREHHQRVMALFRRAVEMEPSQREAYLAEACGDDDALRADVREMLDYDAVDGDGFAATGTSIGRQIIDAALTQPLSKDELSRLPAKIGGYRPVRIIGQGGMGIVYEAEQDSPRRTVALKMIRGGAMTPSHLRRFRLEAELLGRLQHPGIARIYEAGTLGSEDGSLPFFAMELIEGLSITTFSEREKLGTRARLELFVGVCDAVHHAHEKGVVHRDLKPDNILVDSAGVPKILDFGVARATDADVQVSTLQTDVGSLIGTVPYMSPEQISGRVEEIDTRSDVYALGVLLFELLAERLPHDLRGRSVVEAARIISEDEPTRLGSIASRFRQDLDIIVGKAMEKEAQRRYQSAAELGADVQRFLNLEPITARPPSTFYLARRFARRHRAIVIGALTTILAAVGLAIAIKFAIDAQDSATDFQSHAAVVRWKSYCSTIEQAANAVKAGDVSLAERLLDDTDSSFRGWEQGYLTRRITPVEDHRLTVDRKGRILYPHWSSDGRPRVLQIVDKSIVRFIDVRGGDTIHEERELEYFPYAKAHALSRDGSRFARISFENNTVVTRETEGEREWTINTSNTLSRAAYIRLSHRGTRLLCIGSGLDKKASNVIVFDVESGTELFRNTQKVGWSYVSANLSRDATRVAVSTEIERKTEFELFDLETGSSLDRMVVAPAMRCALFCNDDNTTIVAAPFNSKHLYIWQPQAANPLFKIACSPSYGQAAFSPDGKVFGFARDGAFETWDFKARQRVGVYPGPPGRGHLAFDPTGTRMLVTTGNVVRIVQLEAATLTEFSDANQLHLVAFSPDGSLLATAGASGRVQLWDTLTGDLAGAMKTGTEIIEALSFSENGQRLFTATRNEPGRRQTLEMWNVTSRSRAREIKDGTWLDHIHAGGAAIGGSAGIGFTRSADGSRSVRQEKQAVLVAGASHTVVARIEAAGMGLSISRDNRLISTGGNAPKIWDAETGVLIRGIATLNDELIYSTAFSADSKRLVGGGRSGTVYVWDVATGDLICNLEEHTDSVHHVVFSPDGTQLATVSGDWTAHLFDSMPFEERRRRRMEAEARRKAMHESVAGWRETGVDEQAILERVGSDESLTVADRCAVMSR